MTDWGSKTAVTMVSWEREKYPWEHEEANPLFDKTVRYRCEQKVLNRIDGMVTSHSETQREFALSFDSKMKSRRFKAEATESFVKITPANMSGALELINGIDVIKSGAEVMVDSQTGNICEVVNFEEIKKRWEERRSEMFRTIDLSREKAMEERRELEKFTDIIDAQFCDEPTFRKELVDKLFFDVFFDKYLVRGDFENCKFERTFHSFLFDQTPIETTLTQAVSTDKETGLKKISRYISFDDQRLMRVVRHHIMNIYRERYQPIIKYNFTQYNYEFYHDILLADDGLPQDIKVNIIEEVRNNIEMLVTYQIRRLK